MTVADENQLEGACIAGVGSGSDAPVLRRSLLGAISLWSLPRKMSLASAALFAGFAARGATPALAHPGQGNYLCCNLARPDQWCAPASGDPPFVCDHGGFKRVWYCCQANHLVGCGECQQTTSCCSGPNCTPGAFYCSYGWFYEYQYC